jgi:type III secretion protein L
MSPRPLGRILPAEEAGLYRDAATAYDAALMLADRLRQDATAEIEAERVQQRALAQQEASREASRLLAEAAAAASKTITDMRCDIAEAIAEGVAKVIGGAGLAEAVARAAQRAIADLTERNGLIVRVHPASATRTRVLLSGRGEGARVVADESLLPDECTIETRAGFVRAGLSEQIAILREALRERALTNA